ncbi:MAG: hypothetical protein KBS94_04745 [Prevotella sp.]|nr:hypothetical protein [Candidatus Equicola faecalis]
MKKRIANHLFIAVIILASILTLCIGIYENQREHAFRCDILHYKLQLNNYNRNDTTIRLTVISTDGKVLYDSKQNNAVGMENHLQRKEVQEALQKGSGYDIKRTSYTKGEEYFYSATYFPDSGIIVRSAVPYSVPITESLEKDYTFLYYTIGIFLLLAIVLYFRHRLSHSEKEKQRIKQQLTENAAHELKTPAATIEGYLETIVNNPDLTDEKRNEFLERCYSQSRRMSQLLTDMSTLTRLDEAHLSRPNTEIDAADIIRQIEGEMASLFMEKEIALHIDIPDNMPMLGDYSLIFSLFHNIFSNTLVHAIGATHFQIHAKANGDRYTFTFSDNGVGVNPEYQSCIFERFYRIDKSRSRRLGGTGLGLAIVKNIAMQYGGNSTAHTTLGGGLTIVIDIQHSLS